jgi:putative tricarboxylic transport membrane protein
MLQGILSGFGEVLAIWNLVLIFLGTTLGILVGALPGLSSPMAIIVLLPLTYGMEAVPALLVMMGVYVGTKLGGSFSAILLRTPGTPASACTALDGYPMGQRGEAGKALGYATMGSTVGGLFGWLIAVTGVPLLAKIAVKSTNADIALVAIVGLIMVSAFVRGSMMRGLIGVLIGLILGTVGLDPMDATERMTFGSIDLMDGIPFTAALIGFFGIAVVLSDIEMIGRTTHVVSGKVNMALPSFRDLARRWQTLLIGGCIGTGVGAIPGVGAEGATWLSYAVVRNKSKTPEKFGQGEPDGILAPETTNNATTGGTMVPMLTLGIPGDGSTAVMLGALILHGVEPGVMLMRTHAELVNALLASLLIATIFMFFIAWTAIRYFILVLQRDRSWLFPFVLVLASVGAFAISNTLFPVIVALCLGVVGYILEKRNFPVVTIVLGVILGPIIEQNLRLALALSDGDWTTFVGTWPRQIIFTGIVCLILWEIYKNIQTMQGGKAKPAE